MLHRNTGPSRNASMRGSGSEVGRCGFGQGHYSYSKKCGTSHAKSARCGRYEDEAQQEGACHFANRASLHSGGKTKSREQERFSVRRRRTSHLYPASPDDAKDLRPDGSEGRDRLHFRHTIITDIYEATHDANIASAVAGHSKTSITMNRYSHARRDAAKQGMRAIDEAYDL